jgi:hypothetical protein
LQHPYWGKFSNIVEIDVNTSIDNNIMCDGNKGEGRYFNLQGQRMLNPKNGIYIVNGKKVFLK